jgi:Transcriptional regulator, AbiEi antitoxin
MPTRGEPFALDPARSALLVVDMQNDFVREGAPQEVPQARVVSGTIATARARRPLERRRADRRPRPRRRWFPRSMLAGMDGVGHVGQPDVDFRDRPPRDVAIARLAEGQHTVVSLTQLNAVGLGKAAVRKRAAPGRLHRIYQGVYAVGHGRLGRKGHWLAAVLAYGPSAVLSHRSAAALWGLRSDNRAKTDNE